MKFKQYYFMTKLSVIAMLTLSGCFSDSVKDNRPTHIDFENTEIDMGSLTLNHPETATFSFENTGEAPLLIYSAGPVAGVHSLSILECLFFREKKERYK